MENIEIRTYGLILNGEYKDWYICIQPLHKDGGSYLVLLESSLDANNREGYDDWVENYEDLQKYFEGMEIKWLDKKRIQ